MKTGMSKTITTVASESVNAVTLAAYLEVVNRELFQGGGYLAQKTQTWAWDGGDAIVAVLDRDRDIVVLRVADTVTVFVEPRMSLYRAMERAGLDPRRNFRVL